MKISYAITVCKEFVEIQKLIPFLLKHKRHEDEIVILYDISNGHEGIEQFLRAKSINGEFAWIPGEFKGHFADWKNKLNSFCKGDYIFQIDADELPPKYLVENLWTILEMNKTVDVYRVPRINTVKGLTQEHIQKWRWRVDNKGRVNFPDYQWRIYKNNPNVKWVNKVHEVLTGFETMSELPPEKEYCLLHEKTIKRQEKQNSYYNTL
jgi:hypothetical protein